MNQVFQNVAATAAGQFPPAGQFVCVTGTFHFQPSANGFDGFIDTGRQSVLLFVDLGDISPLGAVLRYTLLDNRSVRACGTSGSTFLGFSTMFTTIPTFAPGATPGITSAGTIGTSLGQ